ncbi:unnamed protein product [Calypogeia fissa]
MYLRLLNKHDATALYGTGLRNPVVINPDRNPGKLYGTPETCGIRVSVQMCNMAFPAGRRSNLGTTFGFCHDWCQTPRLSDGEGSKRHVVVVVEGSIRSPAFNPECLEGTGRRVRFLCSIGRSLALFAGVAEFGPAWREIEPGAVAFRVSVVLDYWVGVGSLPYFAPFSATNRQFIVRG